MRNEEHVKLSEKLLGIGAPDIHEWIDGLFDRAAFERFRFTGQLGFNPYGHRMHRHCREAEDLCVAEFRGKYAETDIRAVFRCHVTNDYHGCYPSRADFADPAFLERHHSE